MKRIITLFLISIMFISTTFFAYAEEYTTKMDYDALAHGLQVRDSLDSDLTVHVLYDASGAMKYLLGTTKCHYIILEKDTYVFHEGGEGNPYNSFMEDEKYYGGPLCYFVKHHDEKAALDGIRANQYYDIVHRGYVPEVVELEKNYVAASKIEAQPDGLNATTTNKVLNYIAYIKRRAFGWNESNTCSAVALGLALNYFTLQYEDDYVPSNWVSEYRTAEIETATSYPKAQTMHNYLVNSCGMTGPCYGNSLQYGFTAYKLTKIPSTCSINLSWTLSPAINTVKSHINNNRPVLITTTTGNPEATYNWHTMLVYGYRVVNGVTDYIVHNGWYDEEYNTYANGKHTQVEVWYSPTYATYGYYFTLD